MLSIVGETGDGGRSIFVFETFQHAVGAPPPRDLEKLTTFFFAARRVEPRFHTNKCAFTVALYLVGWFSS